MNKELIKNRFQKNLKTYDKNASVQKKMADKLLKMLNRKNFDNVLEIGCGTGILTKSAISNLVYEKYTAIDIVNCEKYIKEISENINFIEQDAEDYIKNNNVKYDLILSNAALQWVNNFPDFIHLLVSNLNPNGILLFTTFGTENFREISFALDKSLKYYSLSQLKDMFSEYQPLIEEEIRILAFKTPKDVLKHISLTGVNAIEQAFWTKSKLREFENIFNNISSNSPTLTYNPIYIKIG